MLTYISIHFNLLNSSMATLDLFMFLHICVNAVAVCVEVGFKRCCWDRERGVWG